MIIALYVDDLLAATNSKVFLIIGIEIIRDRPNRRIMLSQRRYIQDICERYGMADANTVCTPLDPNVTLSVAQSPQSDTERAEMKSIPYQNITGSLLYAAMATRPDIAFAVGSLCRFNSNYGYEHWLAAKRVVRYLKGTQDLSIVYDGNGNPQAVTYS